MLIAALSIRFRRNRGDMWIFRRTSTSRGSFITPHFAVSARCSLGVLARQSLNVLALQVAWQVSSLFFLIVLQVSLSIRFCSSTERR